MNASSPSFDGPQRPAAPSSPRYRTFVAVMLWTDVVMCALRTFAVLSAIFVMGLGVGGVGDDEATLRNTGEVILGAAVATTGFVGNLLLLRRKRVGLAFGWLSLAFVGISLAFAFWVMQGMLANPDSLDCPPDVLIAGVMFGVLLRVSVNFLYLIALRLASRELKHHSG